MRQTQFLDVVDRDEAERRFHAVLDLRPLEAEEVPLAEAWQRVLACDVSAPVDVPCFDRSNVDGFALRAEDTFGASEDRPCRLQLNPEELATGVVPQQAVGKGTATSIATGAVVPRGADAVVMVEYTDCEGNQLIVRRPVTPGSNITFAGTDIGRGETVLRRGDLLTARETGVLAALGLAAVVVVRRPRVAILSTGDEIIGPGAAMRPGLVYDSNAAILADTVRELGGVPVRLGIVADDEAALRVALRQALANDVVLLSGGTSKGAGDVSYRVVGELGSPGIVAHGVALKPGKPLCLAAVRVGDEPFPIQTAPNVPQNSVLSTQYSVLSTQPPAQPPTAPKADAPTNHTRIVPVVVLPGFPTSAIFTFREFVAPVLLRLAGRRSDPATVVPARLPLRINSERGRTEYVLVGLVQTPEPPGLAAYPMGKGSGSVTTFSCADGFLVIPRQREYVEGGEVVDVQLLSQGIQTADLVIIGSHCIGLDYLLGRLQDQGLRTKFLAVGSMGGLAAARRGECDIAGAHLLHAETNTYNTPYLTPDLLLVRGYQRLQGIVFRRGDSRFEGKSTAEAVAAALADPECILINRNRGSGTRVLIDRLLAGARPAGHLTEARSHNAVAAAVAQGRADWGVAISGVAADAGLGFLPLQDEEYDFFIPRARADRAPVQAFERLLAQPDVRRELASLLGPRA